MIQSVLRPGYYLTVSSSGVALEFLSDYASAPGKALFSLTYNTAGELMIKSDAGYYPGESNSSSSALSSFASTANNQTKWRVCLREKYAEFSSTLTNSVIWVKPQGNASIPYETALSARTWCTALDFTVTNGNTAIASASYNTVTGATQSGITTVTVKHIPSGKSFTATVNCGFFENGLYFIQNKETNYLLQPDDNDANHMEQHSFSPADQRWTLTLLSDGYYKIISKDGLALSVQENYVTTADKKLVQEAFDSSESRHKWKITQTTSGGYKVQAASAIENNSNLVMAVGEGITPGTNVEQRVYAQNDIYKDEWLIFDVNIDKQINTPLIKQNDDWCWATSAQMLARTDFPTTSDPAVLRQERNAAVYHVFGDDSATADTYDWATDPQNLLEQGGLPNHTAEAAAHYAGMIDGVITYEAHLAPYSEEILIRFLNDGHPVLRMWAVAAGSYTAPQTVFEAFNLIENINVNWEQCGGHATIISGMEWDATQNCMLYTVLDPHGFQVKLTYSDLVFQTIPISGNTYSELRLWTGTVVIKTEYSPRTVIDSPLGEYSS